MTALSAGLVKLVAAGLVCGGLLTLSGGAQKEILRFGCACLMVILLLSLLRQTDLPAFDTGWYESQVQSQVDDAQQEARRARLEQTELALEQELERQSTALGLNCTFTVTCAADDAGQVTVRQVKAGYLSGPREKLQELRQSIALQLGVSLEQITIQEGVIP